MAMAVPRLYLHALQCQRVENLYPPRDRGKDSEKCTSCGACAVSQALGPTLGTFQQSCTTGGQSSTQPCTFCKQFPISLELALCYRWNFGLNPNTWSLTQC